MTLDPTFNPAENLELNISWGAETFVDIKLVHDHHNKNILSSLVSKSCRVVS